MAAQYNEEDMIQAALKASKESHAADAKYRETLAAVLALSGDAAKYQEDVLKASDAAAVAKRKDNYGQETGAKLTAAIAASKKAKEEEKTKTVSPWSCANRIDCMRKCKNAPNTGGFCSVCAFPKKTWDCTECGRTANKGSNCSGCLIPKLTWSCFTCKTVGNIFHCCSGCREQFDSAFEDREDPEICPICSELSDHPKHRLH